MANLHITHKFFKWLLLDFFWNFLEKSSWAGCFRASRIWILVIIGAVNQWSWRVGSWNWWNWRVCNWCCSSKWTVSLKHPFLTIAGTSILSPFAAFSSIFKWESAATIQAVLFANSSNIENSLSRTSQLLAYFYVFLRCTFSLFLHIFYVEPAVVFDMLKDVLSTYRVEFAICS